ncbi:MAG: class I SAM-dependent methyltransferase [Candidatus Omnitrophica bacterium]|nr:class I SAM-dependent methyltransferase [Candidatus Omnitrophota bacterium]
MKNNLDEQQSISYHAEILANRVSKRFAHLSKKFSRQNIECFRLYDWDIPEVRAVVDWYAGHVVVGEYVHKQSLPDWLPQMAEAVGNALKVPLELVHIKRRQTKVEEGLRYSKMGSQNERLEVKENDLKFWVNLDDFLDTGLFSDHRDTRSMIRKLAAGKDFLNLYGYTGTFSCAAALGGCQSTVTVDRSATYLKWAEDNFKLNGITTDSKHIFERFDVEKYLIHAAREKYKFTLAFVDPPSFFKDHEQERSFDVDRDHPQLLQQVLKVMVPDSFVFFSTNHQRFTPKFDGLKVQGLTEITAKTIPEDYRNKQIHRCWKMIAI